MHWGSNHRQMAIARNLSFVLNAQGGDRCKRKWMSEEVEENIAGIWVRKEEREDN